MSFIPFKRFPDFYGEFRPVDLCVVQVYFFPYSLVITRVYVGKIWIRKR